PSGLHDRRVWCSCQVKGVPPQRVPVRAYVLACRPVAALTGDAELDGLCIYGLSERIVGAEWCAERRPPVRGVALHADTVPASALRDERDVGRVHHGRTARNPAPLGRELNCRQLAQQPTVPGRVPVDLLMVRTGGHYDSTTNPRWRVALAVPVGLVDLGPQFLAAALQKHRPAVHLIHADTVKTREDRCRRRYLGHGPMVRTVPACVL